MAEPMSSVEPPPVPHSADPTGTAQVVGGAQGASGAARRQVVTAVTRSSSRASPRAAANCPCRTNCAPTKTPRNIASTARTRRPGRGAPRLRPGWSRLRDRSG